MTNSDEPTAQAMAGVRYEVMAVTADRVKCVAHRKCRTWAGALRSGRALRKRLPADHRVWVHECTPNSWSGIASFTITRTENL